VTSLHVELKSRESVGLFGDESRKSIGHEGQELAVGGKVGKIRDGESFIADSTLKALDFLMRALRNSSRKPARTSLRCGRVNVSPRNRAESLDASPTPRRDAGPGQ